MGNTITQAKEKANTEKEEEKDIINGVIQTLENKLEALELIMTEKRGRDKIDDKEVTGGRSVIRIKQINVSDGNGVSEQLTKGIENFFAAASNGIEDDQEGAKKCAIEGAKNLVSAGLDALFGVSNGQGLQRQSFVVMFLNNAFVRVDYFIYSYSVSAKQWGAEANQSGTCYIADLAVLKTSSLEVEEIDFLLTQALAINNGEFDELNRLKIALIQSSILSRALEAPDLDFKQLTEIAKSLAESRKDIDEAFKGFEDYIRLEDRKGPEEESKEKETLEGGELLRSFENS